MDYGAASFAEWLRGAAGDEGAGSKCQEQGRAGGCEGAHGLYGHQQRARVFVVLFGRCDRTRAAVRCEPDAGREEEHARPTRAQPYDQPRQLHGLAERTLRQAAAGLTHETAEVRTTSPGVSSPMCIHPRACVRCLCTSMRPAWHVHERLHGIRTVRPLCTDSSSTFITEEGGTHWMLKMSRASGGTSEADARPMFGLSDAAPARTAPPILNTVPERIGLKRPPRPQSALGTTVPASPFLISRVVCVRPRVLHLVCCGPFCTSVCAPSAVALLHACGRRR